MTTIDGIYLKLDRADVHVKTLHSEIVEALQRADNRTYPDPNAEPLTLLIRAKIGLVPDVAWSITIGECAYQLRSALDHLAWQLSAKHGTGTVPGGCEFPIFTSASKFSGRDAKGDPKYGSGLYKMRGMAPVVQDAIERMQPYHVAPPAISTLRCVHELSNHDKHRLLHLVTTTRQKTNAQVVLEMPGAANSIIDHAWAATGPVEDGAPIVTFKLPKPTSPHSKLTVKIQPSFDVGFGEGTEGMAGEPVVETLGHLAAGVRFTVDELVKLGGL